MTRTKLYNAFVNRIPGIRERYQEYRNETAQGKRLRSWLYLAKLNVQYYVFRNKSVGKSMLLNPDDNKRVYMGAESAISKLENAQEFLEQYKDVDVFTFDVFDTLILRKLGSAEDVFYMVQEKFNYPGFKKIRKEAEREARAERYSLYSDYEVTFEEIWTKVSEKTGIRAEDGMAAEWEAEQSVCIANPYFFELINTLVEQKKTIAVCSDMYLGIERIKCLLKNCGFPQFAGYYVSSDFRKSKNDGQLYYLIKEHFGSQLTYLQIGDNEYSDIKQAKKCGFQTCYYHNVNSCGNKYRAKDMSPVMSSIYSGIVNNTLHNGRFEYSPEFEFGFIYGGLFVTGYCQFIHNYAKNNKIEKLLFLSRDGDVLKKAYEILYPTEKESCKYAYWSRLSSTKLSARILKAHYCERMIIHKTNQGYTISDIFHTMELDDLLSDFIKNNNSYNADSNFNSDVADNVLNYIENNWYTVCEHYDSQIEEGKRYYSSLIGDSQTVAAVDVGWVGSGAIILQKMFEEVWKIDCEIKGIIAGTCSGSGVDYESTAIETANGRLVSYLFSASENRDIWKTHDAAKGHNMIVELLLSSNEKSFRGFMKNSDDEYSFNAGGESINADEIQRGVLHFVKEYAEHPLGHLQIQGRDAAAPIMLIYKNEKYIDNIIKISGIVANIE